MIKLKVFLSGRQLDETQVLLTLLLFKTLKTENVVKVFMISNKRCQVTYRKHSEAV